MKLAVIGTVGVPASYGGFETLAENLVRYHESTSSEHELTVYCSAPCYPDKPPSFLSAQLRYLPLKPNGVASVLYDLLSMMSAVMNGSDVILLLGVSGATCLPLLRLLSSARVITNIDGIEWRRGKWGRIARAFLRFSEWVAVRSSHFLIADNAVISDYVRRNYAVPCELIAYGGDHSFCAEPVSVDAYGLPENYAVSVCRIEPENNIHLITSAFALQAAVALVLVGNWDDSEYGRQLREKYAQIPNMYLLDPVYDLGKLKTLRSAAVAYIHGHSAGGTNPSLVEAMHFGRPIFAFDCEFNRATTEDSALFFRDSSELLALVERVNHEEVQEVGRSMREVAQRRYTWDAIGSKYFDLFARVSMDKVRRGDE